MQLDTLLAMLATPWCMGLIGLCIGSFLNVVIHRLPKMLERQWRIDSAAMLELPEKEEPELNLVKPASRCPSCGHLIRWYENIPVLSWMFLRGKCSACKTPISVRYPLVEIGTALLFAATSWRFHEHPVALAWAVFVAIIVAAALIDWDTTLLPDDLTFPLLWAGLLASLLANLPFAVQPIQRGFEAIARDVRDAAACCGLSPWQRFVRIDAGQSLEAVRADVLATVQARTAAPGSAAS